MFRWTGMMIFLSAALISCQKKSNSSGYVTPPAVYNPGLLGQAAGCGNYSQVQLGQAVSQGSGFTIQWSITGDQASAQQLVYLGVSPTNYSGPVCVTGTINVTQPISLSGGIGYGYNTGCVLPAGTYQIYTAQVGQASYGTISGMVLQTAATGIQTQFAASLVFMDPNYTRQITGIYGQLVSATCGGGISFSQ